MSLGSPWMLLSLALVPRPGARVREARATTISARRPPRNRGARADHGVPAWAAVATARPVRAVRVGARPRLRRARPADDELRAPATGRHGDPRLRRVQQHAGRRSRAHPDRRGEGRGHGVRGATAEHDPDRHRGVRRQRPHGAPADRREGGGGRGDPAPLAERRHLARPGPLHLAQHDRRQAPADRRVRTRERRRRGRHRVLRLVGDRPALGRGEHLARPTPCSSPRSRPRRASASMRSGSGHRKGRWWRSTGSASRPRSTRSS